MQDFYPHRAILEHGCRTYYLTGCGALRDEGLADLQSEAGLQWCHEGIPDKGTILGDHKIYFGVFEGAGVLDYF